MTKLRVGLVGLGAMGRQHLRILSRLQGVEIVGAVDPHVKLRELSESVFVVDSVNRLINLGLDYCVVAAPTAVHSDIAMPLARFRVPTLIEKPLAPDVDTARRLVDAFGSGDVLAAVGHIERYNSAIREAYLKINDGLIGDVLQVATRRQSPFPSRITDVGVVMDLATHDVDLTSWITNQEYSEVSARVICRSRSAHEDLVAVVGTLKNGTVVSHLVNWISPRKDRQTLITGSNGSLEIDTLTSSLSHAKRGKAMATWDALAEFSAASTGEVTQFEFAKPEPLLLEHEQFRDAVFGQAADIVPLADGLKAVRVANAILESARSGQTACLD